MSPLDPDALEPEALDRAADILTGSRYAVALAGAGMSKESGIPTFRGEGGLWTRLGEPPLNQYQTFASDPARWWERRIEEGQQSAQSEFALALEAAQPNDGHRALAELEEMGILAHLITQNIDDLHRRAGQRSITEIHGNRYWMRCTGCGARWPREEFIVDPDHLPPTCADERCGGIVKSDTVMFGEPIPAEALHRSALETAQADCFLTLGTSAVVYPAAGYPIDAAQRGVPLIEVNPEDTPLTPLATVVLRAPSGDALPRLVEAVRARREGRS
ncbi:MAG: NAD-dependent protein deacylase [Dehalococcoidia bacterium]|nr:NAD-dependent protein deacylase [Dehalococcoidia bacterium]